MNNFYNSNKKVSKVKGKVMNKDTKNDIYNNIQNLADILISGNIRAILMRKPKYADECKDQIMFSGIDQ